MLTVQRARLIVTVAAACAAALSGPALADKPFSGEDAAYMDWAWKSCDLVVTQKERGLADTARDKGGDGFSRAYDAQYRKIIAATADEAAVRRQCEQITGWYGSLGTRIGALVEAKRAKTDSPGTSIGSRASSSSSGRGGGGGGRRRGGM